MSIELPSKIAFIVPRYAKSIGGGAETLLRDLAHAIVKYDSEIEVEVWTTCALDHRSWANELEPGVEYDGRICVRRFLVGERDLEVFINSEHQIQGGQEFAVENQLAWLEASVNSKELYEHIQSNGLNYDVLIFAPYLFATTFWGSLIYPQRSLIVPCLHDECYAYLDIFRYQFSKVRGILCNAEPEMDLVKSVMGDCLEERKLSVVGMGFDPVESVDAAANSVLEIQGKKLSKPFLLYSGRKELGKNVGFLLECFEQMGDLDCSLVLIGAGEIDFRDSLPERVIDLGFVSEDEKQELMANCLALCQPSQNESFSIVMMESWQQGAACIVHGDCPVTRHHVSVSNGGLYFENAREFAGVVKYLIKNPGERQKMGDNGRQYVQTQYCWTSVLERFSDALRQFGILASGEKTIEVRSSGQ